MKHTEYKDFAESVSRFNAQVKQKPYGTALHLMQPMIANLDLIASTMNLSKLSKSTLLGLTGSLFALDKTTSKLGLFSPEFIKFNETLAHNLHKICFEKQSAATEKTLALFLQFSLISVIGIFTVGFPEPARTSKFQKQLFTDLFFTADVPKTIFTQLALCLNATPKGVPLLASSMEVISLIAVSLAFSREPIGLAEFLLPRLQQELTTIDKLLDDNGSTAPLRAMIRQAILALETQNLEPLHEIVGELLNNAHYPLDTVFNDFDAMRKLFTRYSALFYYREPVTEVTFIG